MMNSEQKRKDLQLEYALDVRKATKFITESNKIEGISRKPNISEISEHLRFMKLEEVKVADLQQFVKVYQPDAKLRLNFGDNVIIGSYVPPAGGQNILYELDWILTSVNGSKKNPFNNHLAYESLHPFTDGNGRSGRMLWLWQMKHQNYFLGLGFLHTFYYQAFENWSNRNG